MYRRASEHVAKELHGEVDCYNAMEATKIITALDRMEEAVDNGYNGVAEEYILLIIDMLPDCDARNICKQLQKAEANGDMNIFAAVVGVRVAILGSWHGTEAKRIERKCERSLDTLLHYGIIDMASYEFLLRESRFVEDEDGDN